MIAYILAFASSFLTFISYGFGYLWCGFCLCASYYGYNLYYIKSKEKVMSLMSKVKLSAMKDENNKSQWFFIGTYFVGTFMNNDKGQVAYIMCSSKTFKNLTEIVDLSIKSEKIDIYERSGSYFWLDYDKREFIVDKYIANKKQSVIMEEIVNFYKIRKNSVVFIYGEPGSGKSMCSILLAKQLKGTLVRTFNPSDPNDSIGSLYSTIDPTEDKPLILVLDEVNILYHRVYHNDIPRHKNFPTQILDKPSLNRFFDDINLGIYPNMIIVMTSNMSAKEIEEKYDPSYIREGRVDLRFNLEKDIEICDSIKSSFIETTDTLSTDELTEPTFEKIKKRKKFLRIPKFLKKYFK